MPQEDAVVSIPLENVIVELQKKRPIFHSEADFQHALAWEIHTHFPAAAVRLEIHPRRTGPREYIDIWVKHGGMTYALELKYKTRKIDVVYEDEEFHLLNHGAQDTGRYDFAKDVMRLERFVATHPEACGYAFLLTNEPNYWQTTTNLGTADALFRIHDGRMLTGELKWSEATGAGTMRGRESPLTLNGSHHIRWVDYSTFNERGPAKFRYILLKVESLANRRPQEAGA